MSLRFKLPLFTAIFVILASIAMLSISKYQTKERGKKDIRTVNSLSERSESVKELLAFRNPNNFIILNSQNLSELWNEMRPALDKYAAGNPDFALGGIPYQEMKKDIAVLIQGLTDGARRIKRIADTLKRKANSVRTCIVGSKRTGSTFPPCASAKMISCCWPKRLLKKPRGNVEKSLLKSPLPLRPCL